jgi:hypothetical protein
VTASENAHPLWNPAPAPADKCRCFQTWPIWTIFAQKPSPNRPIPRQPRSESFTSRRVNAFSPPNFTSNDVAVLDENSHRRMKTGNSPDLSPFRGRHSCSALLQKISSRVMTRRRWTDFTKRSSTCIHHRISYRATDIEFSGALLRAL